MLVSIYYNPSLFNAHTMVLIVHIFMNVNKLALNQQRQAFFLASVARIAYLMLGTIVACSRCPWTKIKEAARTARPAVSFWTMFFAVECR